MSFAKTYSAQTAYLTAFIVTIEVDLARGLNSFSVVGLPDKAVEEAKDRISAAIKNSGRTSPKQKNQKVVIALAPAYLKKEGPAFDLAMALAYLLAAEDISFDPEKKLFLGELSLRGEVRPVSGVLPLVDEARRRGFEEIFVPWENAEEAALIRGVTVRAVRTLEEVVRHLDQKHRPEPPAPRFEIPATPATNILDKTVEPLIDFADIHGQETGKRGLEIAAAGGHNIALFGPPGTGKTMLARAFSEILPPLSYDEVLETTAIHSVAGVLDGTLMSRRPFRAPHHTSSYVSLVGGGAFPKPGEVTLAHRGVLFMDEFPEFDRRVIEALRQPLEDRVVSVSRARGSAHFPADFILVAAMNPCPCGNFGSKDKVCVCPPAHLLRYRRKISGPIADRIDMWIEVPAIAPAELGGARGGEKTSAILDRVLKARDRQKKRFAAAALPLTTNSGMSARTLEKMVPLSETARATLNAAAEKIKLSGRAYHRVLKLARTIADLEGSDAVMESHLMEAIGYRPKDTVL